jgi:CO/xanthine dehydrogenase Mo-binding subunit/aerobic-type carbon monoxide dehydrogenase small subunit (CoxS/CutS family)
MKPALQFTLNGRPVAVEAPPAKSLLEVLRDDLRCTGPKIGCLQGECGACSVLIDDELVNACLVPVGKVAGCDVVTIEGMTDTPLFRAIQRAFMEKSAVQCGICTPGIVVATRALLEQHPHPTREAIRDFLGGNLCRCTGYTKIIDAVAYAATLLRQQGGQEEARGPQDRVGQSAFRIDAPEKIAGTARYGDDWYLDDMHYLQVVRSPYDHAVIVHIDTEEACRIPGVVRVLTARDIPGVNRFGIILEDQPVLAEDTVRYRGEAVALVIATRRETAKLAATRVRVAYHPLPNLLSPSVALQPEAPRLHSNGNLLAAPVTRKGNIEEGFAQADVIVENDYQTTFIEHAYIEPEAGVAYVDPEGRVTLIVSTQTPYLDRDACASILGVPPEQVRVIQAATGGGFGGKLDLSLQPFLALAAHAIKKPVKLTYSREESFLSTTKRHPYSVRYKLGAKQDGTLVAAQVHIVGDTGAYASWGPTVIRRAVIHAGGPYVIPHYYGDGKVVYTNNPICGAMRGFSTPQVAFAAESQLDMLARKLGLDPIDIRLKNCLKRGSATVTGQVLEASVGIEATLLAVRDKWHELQRYHPLEQHEHLAYGVGVACMWYGIGNTALSNPSTVRLALDDDGRVHLYTSAADIGQGSSTTLLQILAQEMQLPLSEIRLTTADTLHTPNSGKTSASRQIYITGRAVQDAAGQLKDLLRRHGAELLHAAVDDVHVTSGRVYCPKNAAAVTLAQLAAHFRAHGIAAECTGYFDPVTASLDDNGQGAPYPTYGFATHLAQVQVDPRTGEVRVRRFIAAHDVGKAINPQAVEGQIEGGVVMGMGFALTEHFIPGQTTNFSTYLIPTFQETPTIYPLIIESMEPTGPFGAKGVGELAMIGTAPAITNAIYDAVGVRIRSLPATPEKIFRGLRGAVCGVGKARFSHL